MWRHRRDFILYISENLQGEYKAVEFNVTGIFYDREKKRLAAI